MGDQLFQKVKRRCVQPLQIVKEQRQRLLFPREDAEKAPENHLETVLRVLRRQVRNRRLLSDHQLQLGNEVHHELAVRAQRFAESVPPRPSSASLCPKSGRTRF